MKFARLLVVLIPLLGVVQSISAQCNNATPYGTITAPAPGASNMVSCTYAGEYNTVNSVAAEQITLHQAQSVLISSRFVKVRLEELL